MEAARDATCFNAENELFGLFNFNEAFGCVEIKDALAIQAATFHNFIVTDFIPGKYKPALLPSCEKGRGTLFIKKTF